MGLKFSPAKYPPFCSGLSVSNFMAYELARTGNPPVGKIVGSPEKFTALENLHFNWRHGISKIMLCVARGSWFEDLLGSLNFIICEKRAGLCELLYLPQPTIPLKYSFKLYYCMCYISYIHIILYAYQPVCFFLLNILIGWLWFKHILFHNQRTALRLYQLLLLGWLWHIMTTIRGSVVKIPVFTDSGVSVYVG